jgi:hypothetical protein
MTADLVGPAINLGVAGFAILVMWWMYQSAAEERKRNDERLDRRDQKYDQLQEKVRGEITATLVAATSTNQEAMKVMERVLDHLNKH